MAKRRLKLLALALSILVARSFAVLIQISRVTQVNRHKAPRTTRCAFSSASDAAQYLEPFATVVGISLKDIVVGLQAANNNINSLSGQETLVDSKYAREHAESLAKTLVESTAKSEQFRNIFLPRILLPRIPVNGTKFQHLVSNVLSDTSFTGASSIHAEPGVGKSVAVALAMLEWAKYNPKSITVLFRGSVARLKDFFRVEDITLVPVVAELLFPILEEAGVRLQLILDNIFDKDLAEGKIVMDLAKAAFDYGQVIIVTQSEVVAKDVDDLNGLRTRLAPQQEDAKEYRWNETQAIQLFVALNATKKVNSSEPKEIEDAVKMALQEFEEDHVAISKTLESARFPDGGWTPVGIIQFRRSGKQPVSAAGATAAITKAVWVRQLRKDGKGGFEFVGNAFPIDPVPENIAYLKKAIKKEKPNKVQCDADEIDIFSQEDGKWSKEGKMSASLHDNDEDAPYGYIVP